MSIEFKLPDLGENISSAGVLAVLVKPGDTIKRDTPVLEIETDKATIEVPSTVAGKVSNIHVKPGDKAEVGQVVLTLEGEDAPQKEEKPKAEAPPQQPPAEAKKQEEPKAPAAKAASGPQEVKLPDLGENITSANILGVLVKVGDKITADTGMLEIETDKATIEVPAGVAGTVDKIHVKAGEKAAPGQVILTVSGVAAAEVEKPKGEGKAQAPVAVAPTPAKAAPNGTSKPSAPPVKSGRAAAAAPSVRRLAREIGVDVNVVRGTGPKGRISHEDVKATARALLKAQPAPGQAGAPGAWRGPVVLPLPDFTKFGTVEREGMNNIRKKTAENMAQAWSTIPMVTQFDKADVTDLEKLRVKLDPKARQAGGKLTVTAILMKVCASALKRFPKFNASIDLAKEEVVFKKYFNIGVAVDTERGLLVPVVKNVSGKNIFEISADLQVIAEKARNRKVSPDDLQGSCFTITNLGGIGGTSFTPIVNPPEVAILGVSRSSVEPVWQDDKFVPRTLLPLSLSYDHRLIDGAEAARFLRFVCEALENPALLLFEG
ncbi:branched-chain alpha-keto acid dehydrogenase subunit E2 [bacterium SCN 62-11]|nr:dihydrolipoyllysine-residue acetyltransferase [Candidatus Eremiobacteraeota bacterium]ODT72107.1 MAG: branched-chain alpha-keto acid dehydrogenase subunit E2 [bacterium SCN 62-11]